MQSQNTETLWENGRAHTKAVGGVVQISVPQLPMAFWAYKHHHISLKAIQPQEYKSVRMPTRTQRSTTSQRTYESLKREIATPPSALARSGRATPRARSVRRRSTWLKLMQCGIGSFNQIEAQGQSFPSGPVMEGGFMH